MLKKTVFLSFFLWVYFLPAQDMHYARQLVDTLTSPFFHGRGYVNEGEKKAAVFIRNEFKNLGLKAFKDRYFQPFDLTVNTFPGRMHLYIGKEEKELVPGQDYIVDPDAPSAQFKQATVLWVDSLFLLSLQKEKKLKKFLEKEYKNTVLVFDGKEVKTKEHQQFLKQLEQAPLHCAAKLILQSKKLTWSVGNKQSEVPSFDLLIPDSLNAEQRKKMDRISCDIETKLIKEYSTQNIVGYVEGAVYPDSFIVFSAHYDHLGQMGDAAYFPGANDNASGTAMLLNLAKYYAQPENKPRYSIAFISFSAEEAGLLGSAYYVGHPLFPLPQIKFLVNVDIMGTGNEGITVVNATVHPQAFDTLVNINKRNNYLKQVKPRGKAHNSDHYYFSEAGVPAFFIYTMGGIKAYHDIYDRGQTLPLTEFSNAFRLIRDFSTSLMQAH